MNLYVRLGYINETVSLLILRLNESKVRRLSLNIRLG